jgi:hypothetical protein
MDEGKEEVGDRKEMKRSRLNNDQQNSQTGVAYCVPHKHLLSLEEESSDKLHYHIKQILGGTLREANTDRTSKSTCNQYTDHVVMQMQEERGGEIICTAVKKTFVNN